MTVTIISDEAILWMNVYVMLAVKNGGCAERRLVKKGISFVPYVMAAGVRHVLCARKNSSSVQMLAAIVSQIISVPDFDL